MWTVFILITCSCLHFSVPTALPNPVNVSFSSVNLRNVLHWLPGNNTPQDTLFTVEYAIYGDSVEGNKGRRVNWRAVQKCQEIVRTWCDLSSETEDEEQGYHARVRAVTTGASSKWALTRRRFDPKVDTSFGPPLVSVEIENNSAVITLKGPMRYPTTKDSTEISLATIYPQMTYSLSINNTYRNQVHHVPVVASPHKHRLLDYNTQYCFSARSHFLSMPIECQPSAWHCIITPQDPLIEQLRTVVVSIVVPGLCLGAFVVVGYTLHQYLTGKGQKKPLILNSPYSHPAPVTFPSENPSHIIVSLVKDGLPSDPLRALGPESSQGQRCIPGPPPTYSPQRPDEHPEACDEVSVHYGFVSEAPRVIDDEEREKRLDEGSAETRAVGGIHPRSLSRAVGGHSPGQPAPLQTSYQTQSSLHTYRKTHNAQTETNTGGNVTAGSRINSALVFPGSTDQVSGEEKAVSNGNTDEDGGRESEKKPLLSVYASQNIQNMSASTPSRSQYLPGDYAILSRTTKKTEDDDYDSAGDDEGRKSCVGCNPTLSPEQRLDVLMVPGGSGEDEKGIYVMKGELRLKDVFVRQGSEEELESQRESEQGGETSWQVDELLSKWNLQISMGE